MQFESFVTSGHPVCVVEGDIDRSINLVQESLKHYQNEFEIKLINLNKESISDLDVFFGLFGVKKKIAICVIRSATEYINSILLKRLEDVPDSCSIVIIGCNLPNTILNRGLLISNMYQSMEISDEIMRLMDINPSKILEQNLNQETVFNSIAVYIEKQLLASINSRILSKVEMYNNLWHRICEINFWINHGQIKIEQGIEMIIGLFICSRKLD